MKKALIVWGGWDGHEPELVACRFEKVLLDEGFEVTVSDTLDALLDTERLNAIDLLIPVWTSGAITREQSKAAVEAVGMWGVGIAGCHGGMCDSFREDVEWQFMTGGQWVSHPGGDGVKYRVNIRHTSSPITYGLPDFSVASEHYYMHVDPAVEVLATTRYPVVNYYHAANGEVDVPAAWTKRWGHGRVFYCSLGHHNDVFDDATPLELMRRGMLWAAEGKALAKGTNPHQYTSELQMY